MQALHLLLTPDSQQDFAIPVSIHKDPKVEPGLMLKEWTQRKVLHALYRDNSDYVVTREHDALNRLHIRHSDLNLLKGYCKDSLEITVPEMV